MTNLIPMDERRPLTSQPGRPQGEPVTRKNFFEKGKACIELNSSACAAKCGSEEHKAWATYFRDHLGWTPVFLKMLEAGVIEAMTVPAQWPQWFDPDYAVPA